MALGIVNAVGSTIARETDAGVYLHVGHGDRRGLDQGIRTGQLTVLSLIAAILGRRRHMSQHAYQQEYLTAAPRMCRRRSTRSLALS
jgi:glucosamine--fructose-6-phosphate aminotransferase (isomerizing)